MGQPNPRSTDVRQNFTFNKQIGSGSYARVYLCQQHQDGLKYAIKITPFKGLKDSDKPKDKRMKYVNALREVRLLSSLRHSHILLFKEAFYDRQKEYLCLVTEHMNFNNLEALIQMKIKENKETGE